MDECQKDAEYCPVCGTGPCEEEEAEQLSLCDKGPYTEQKVLDSL